MRRFGEAAEVVYRDLGDAATAAKHADVIALVQQKGLYYPVTVIDDVPVYDGAVSYPMILRAVQERLDAAAEPSQA